MNQYQAINATHAWLVQRLFEDEFANNLAFDSNTDGVPDSLTKLDLLGKAVMNACDDLDGIVDGVIDDPLGSCLRKSLVLWRSCWYAAGHAENTPPQTADAAGRRTPNLGGMGAPPEAGAASGAALADRVGRCGRSDEPSGRRAAGRVEQLRL